MERPLGEIKMKRSVAIFSILSLALAVSACDQAAESNQGYMSPNGLSSNASITDSGYTYAYDDPADDQEGWDFWGGVFTPGTPIAVSDGKLSGDYGNHRINEPLTADVDGYNDGPWTEVNVLAEGPGGASMAIFEVWGGLEALPAGTTRLYDRWDSGSDGAYVSVIGCAGPSPYNWDFDTVADEVEVTVTENADDPTERTYEFTARFNEEGFTWSGGGDSELRGQFVARN